MKNLYIMTAFFIVATFSLLAHPFSHTLSYNLSCNVKGCRLCYDPDVCLLCDDKQNYDP